MVKTIELNQLQGTGRLYKYLKNLPAYKELEKNQGKAILVEELVKEYGIDSKRFKTGSSNYAKKNGYKQATGITKEGKEALFYIKIERKEEKK